MSAVTFIAIIILLFLSAAFSGLNIGLLMVRPEELLRKMRRGDKVAERVYKYRKNGNYLIVCVLLGNVAVISAMSLVMGSVTNGVVAGIITTLLITAFGEILPQSLFSQRGWRLTRHFFWLLDLVFVLFWPLAKPASKLLDRLIGKELPKVYSHEDFINMIHEQAEHDNSLIDHDESRIVSGALNFSHQTVADEMTPIDQVFWLKTTDKLTQALLSRIRKSGHSRIPVQDEQGRFIGVLLVKDLIGRPIGQAISRYHRDTLHDIQAQSSLDTALKRFIHTKSHISIALDDDRPVGIITLEDVIESILRWEIDDEFDD